jgi:hypothetical protein
MGELTQLIQLISWFCVVLESIKTYAMIHSQNANPNHFSLVEVMLDKGVSERELNEDEKPWLIIQKKRRVCINALIVVKYFAENNSNNDIVVTLRLIKRNG